MYGCGEKQKTAGKRYVIESFYESEISVFKRVVAHVWVLLFPLMGVAKSACFEIYPLRRP